MPRGVTADNRRLGMDIRPATVAPCPGCGVRVLLHAPDAVAPEEVRAASPPAFPLRPRDRRPRWPVRATAQPASGSPSSLSSRPAARSRQQPAHRMYQNRAPGVVSEYLHYVGFGMS